MRLVTYKKQLNQTLKKLGVNYYLMNKEERTIFKNCSSHYFLAIGPIIKTDIEIIDEAKYLLYTLSNNPNFIAVL